MPVNFGAGSLYKSTPVIGTVLIFGPGIGPDLILLFLV